MMFSEAKTPLSFLFNIVIQYIQILCTFNFMFVALTTRRSVLPLAILNCLLVGCAIGFFPRVLISRKSTMIQIGGYHGIRL